MIGGPDRRAMLALTLSEFAVELKDGAIKNVGAANKTAAAKLFDVEAAEVREFGDERLKLVFTDASGNEVQAAIDPDAARTVRRSIESLESDSQVFE